MQGNLFYPNLGDIPGARASYAKLRRLRTEVAASRPQDEAAQLGLVHALVRDGDAALAENRLNDAIEHYEQARVRVEATPGQSEARVLAESRVRGDFGVALGQAGRHADAIRQFETALALVEPLANAPGASEAMRRAQMSNHTNVVDVLYHAGRYQDALPHAEQAMALARAMLRDAVDVATARRAVYLTANRLAAALDGTGRVDEAIAAWNEGIEILKQMADADPRNVRLRFDLAGMYQGLATFHLKKQRTTPAWDAINEAFAQWKVAFDANPAATTERYNYGFAFTVLGDVQRARGNLAAAVEAYRQAIDVFADPVVAARSPVDRFQMYESLGDILVERARRAPSADLTRDAREAYLTAREGYAALAKAGQLPEALASQGETVARKIAALPR